MSFYKNEWIMFVRQKAFRRYLMIISKKDPFQFYSERDWYNLDILLETSCISKCEGSSEACSHRGEREGC